MLLDMPHVMPSFNIDQPVTLFFFLVESSFNPRWAVDGCRLTQLLKAIGKIVSLWSHYQLFSISLPIDSW
jgi:hypothetical protein